jgi:hypothetical protein
MSLFNDLLCRLGLRQDTPRVRPETLWPLQEHQDQIKKAAQILHRQRKIAEEVGALNEKQIKDAKDAEVLLRNLVDRIAAENNKP